MTVRVSASLWIRLMAFCTSGSKSWTPTEIRLKPSWPRKAIVSASTLRGSTSIEISASGATLKAPRSMPISVVISSRARNVGVPPPQCSCSTSGVAFDHAADDADLAADILDVLGAAAVVLGDDLVARAVVADRVAERHVDVQRQRLRMDGVPLVARVQRVDVMLGRERRRESGRRSGRTCSGDRTGRISSPARCRARGRRRQGSWSSDWVERRAKARGQRIVTGHVTGRLDRNQPRFADALS